MDDVPDFASLVSFSEVAKRLGLAVGTIHRWRLHPTTPLKAWRLGREWHTTEDDLRDYVRRRTAASMPGNLAAPAPVYTAKRQREIKAAVAECKAMGC